MAELFGLFYIVKLATSLRLKVVHLVNDNKGALYSFSSFQPRAQNYTQVKLLRQTFNLLWWSSLRVNLYWVPSFLNPADHPSRLFSETQPSPFHAYSQALYTYNLLLQQTTLPLFLTTIHIQHQPTYIRRR